MLRHWIVPIAMAVGVLFPLIITLPRVSRRITFLGELAKQSSPSNPRQRKAAIVAAFFIVRGESDDLRRQLLGISRRGLDYLAASLISRDVDQANRIALLVIA